MITAVGHPDLTATTWDLVQAEPRERVQDLPPDATSVVRDAITNYRRAFDENPHSFLDDNMFAREEDMLWRSLCAEAAEYVGGQASEIALTSSTTMGLALTYSLLRALREADPEYVLLDGTLAECDRVARQPSRLLSRAPPTRGARAAGQLVLYGLSRFESA
jgi:hypothetical protein